MPEPGPELVKAQEPGALNDAQRRRLIVTCNYIDKLLCDIEHALHSAASPSPFSHFVVDISPAQMRVIENHIGHLRSQLLHALNWQHMKPEPPRVSVSSFIVTTLAFVDNAIEELRPVYMKGYGAIPEETTAGLNQVVLELHSLVGSVDQNIREELGMPQSSHEHKLRERLREE
jgi:hypothetical protein